MISFFGRTSNINITNPHQKQYGERNRWPSETFYQYSHSQGMNIHAYFISNLTKLRGIIKNFPFRIYHILADNNKSKSKRIIRNMWDDMLYRSPIFIRLVSFFFIREKLCNTYLNRNNIYDLNEQFLLNWICPFFSEMPKWETSTKCACVNLVAIITELKRSRVHTNNLRD